MEGNGGPRRGVGFGDAEAAPSRSRGSASAAVESLRREPQIPRQTNGLPGGASASLLPEAIVFLRPPCYCDLFSAWPARDPERGPEGSPRRRIRPHGTRGAVERLQQVVECNPCNASRGTSNVSSSCLFVIALPARLSSGTNNSRRYIIFVRIK